MKCLSEQQLRLPPPVTKSDPESKGSTPYLGSVDWACHILPQKFDIGISQSTGVPSFTRNKKINVMTITDTEAKSNNIFSIIISLNLLLCILKLCKQTSIVMIITPVLKVAFLVFRLARVRTLPPL